MTTNKGIIKQYGKRYEWWYRYCVGEWVLNYFCCHNSCNTMVDILKAYGILYIEVDLKTGERKEFIRGTALDVFNAFSEIQAKGVWAGCWNVQTN